MKKSAKKKNRFFVYILKCADDTLYTGYSIDLEHRLEKHNSGLGAKYTRGRGPVKVVYKKMYKSLSSALRAEIEIKGLTRKEKDTLIKRSGGRRGT